MKTRILLVALFAFCLTNCASYNGIITQPEVDQIRPGSTTEPDLEDLFGPPDTEVFTRHGGRSLEWFRSAAPGPQSYLPVIGPCLGGLDIDVQQLSVTLGPNGRVSSFTLFDSNRALKTKKTQRQTIRQNGYGK